jgi:hypothetical protein
VLSDASTPLQGTTVSTLTADSSLVDLLVVSGVGEDTTLLPLIGIFHCPFIEESANIETGKKGWFRIPHMPPAGSSKVLHAPARRGGIRRASQTKIYNLETGK